MNQDLRRSLIAAVAGELRARVIDGHAGEVLPGVRVLARTLGVSVPTICRALHRLSEAGLLESGGTRRRWTVSNKVPAAAPAPAAAITAIKGLRSRRLLFLASQPLNHESASGAESFAALLDRLGTSDWEVMYRVEDFLQVKKPRRSWDELLRFTRPDAMVVLGGTPVLAGWAVKHGIRTLLLGGDPGDSGVPMVSVSISSMLREAAERLRDAGHQRVIMPLCARLPEFVMKCRQTAAEINAGWKGNVAIVESPYAGPEVIRDLLRRQWQQAPPDALIFLDWREFVGALGFLNELSIRIPQDVSVIVLTKNAMMDWHSPPISHFEHPVNVIARGVAKWVTGEKSGSTLQEIREIRARWIDKSSVITRAPDPGS